MALAVLVAVQEEVALEVLAATCHHQQKSQVWLMILQTEFIFCEWGIIPYQYSLSEVWTLHLSVLLDMGFALVFTAVLYYLFTALRIKGKLFMWLFKRELHPHDFFIFPLFLTISIKGLWYKPFLILFRHIGTSGCFGFFNNTLSVKITLSFASDLALMWWRLWLTEFGDDLQSYLRSFCW